MKMEDLNKRKFIHWLYVNSKGEFHTERYPVVYINKNYVYYVRGKGQRLCEKDLNMVHESLGSKIVRNMERGIPMDHGVANSCYWSMSSHYIEKLRDFRELQKKSMGAARVSAAKRSVAYAETQLRIAKENLSRVIEEEGDR